MSTVRFSFFYNIAGCLALIGVFLSLVAPARVYADSFTADCMVGGGRSSVKVRSTGINGKFYVLLFSGEDSKKTTAKMPNKKQVLNFRFDSDSAYLNEHPEPDAFFIEPNFIKKREIAVVLRKSDSNAHMGGIRTKCKKYRPNPALITPASTTTPAK